MEHKTLDDINHVASLIPASSICGPKSRKERLERWAILLEALNGEPLQPLMQIEFMSAHQRALVRADNSPLTLAHDDPLLRAAGLKSDRYGDALDFFALTEREGHYLLCDCHYHGTMTANTLAARVRHLANTQSRQGTFTRCWNRLWGR